MKKRIITLSLVCILIVLMSFIIGSAKGGEFVGADDKMGETISVVNPNYNPWAKSLWEPTSARMEKTLFAVQALIGVVFIGYYIGKKKNVKAYNGASQKE
ncbi:MAG: energy-coupling factor ABC transporter substrate-binding protein [Clostridium lundense]|nr:energy-coupling factor ABC transporter substrate-binding protein [Clostridium lundense]